MATGELKTTARSTAEEALLDAAERLLVDVGHAGITTRRLAEEAGINHGLVHYYFGSIENLLARTLERFTERQVARQRAMYAADVPFTEKWRTAMRYLVEEDTRYEKVWYELQALAWNRPELQERVDRVNAAWRAVLAEAFAEPRKHYGIEMPLDALVSLVITFNEGIMLERLSGITGRPLGATRVDRQLAGGTDMTIELEATATEQTRARYPDTSGYVERDGVNLYYEVYGSGEPTVFLLPTWSIIHSRPLEDADPLPQRATARVVTFDGRGNGRSDPPDRARRPTREEEFAADAAGRHGRDRERSVRCWSQLSAWRRAGHCQPAQRGPPRTRGSASWSSSRRPCRSRSATPAPERSTLRRSASVRDAEDVELGQVQPPLLAATTTEDFLEFFFSQCFTEPALHRAARGLGRLGPRRRTPRRWSRPSSPHGSQRRTACASCCPAFTVQSS